MEVIITLCMASLTQFAMLMAIRFCVCGTLLPLNKYLNISSLILAHAAYGT